MHIIEANNISKSFPKGKGFRLEVDSFGLDQNRVYALLGPNGAGKSTFIKCLLNLLIINTGSIKLFGIDNKDANSRKRIGYLPEEFSLPVNLTAKQFLKYFGAMYETEIDIDDNIYQLAKGLNSEAYLTKKVSGLSKGMRQSMMLMHAMIGNPELLILDEPFNGLDPKQKEKSVEFLKEYQKENRATILITTHILAGLEDFCDTIILINNGQIIDESRVEKIFTNYNTIEKYYNEKIA